MAINKGTVSWFLEWRIDRCTQKRSGRKKNWLKKLNYHIFASIRPTERYNHLKWGAKGHLMPLETSFFYLPDRPTAENPLVKNPPFKESTDDALIYVRYQYYHQRNLTQIWPDKTTRAGFGFGFGFEHRWICPSLHGTPLKALYLHEKTLMSFALTTRLVDIGPKMA